MATFQQCPKCGHLRQLGETTSAEQCPVCGIYFAKWLARDSFVPPVLRAETAEHDAGEARWRDGILDRVLYVLIPGINDSEENMRSTVEFAKKLNAQGVEILEYHNLGAPKYERLDMEYTMHDVQPPSEEVVKSLKSISAFSTGQELDISGSSGYATVSAV